ncbi:hypothetical protein [Altibacter lentus]|uniref:hypothetical protein n=1 Tax=Altibacter lentus TaxID=1223410 RepID=UPI0005507477|nr:hypothetical protein [Altibacter lentus]
MVTIDALKLKTDEFFDTFWCLDVNRPVWSSPWYFKGELPHNERKGCYALLLGNEVTYVGLEIGKSYGGSGLGSRISHRDNTTSLLSAVINAIVDKRSRLQRDSFDYVNHRFTVTARL